MTYIAQTDINKQGLAEANREAIALAFGLTTALRKMGLERGDAMAITQNTMLNAVAILWCGWRSLKDPRRSRFPYITLPLILFKRMWTLTRHYKTEQGAKELAFLMESMETITTTTEPLDEAMKEVAQRHGMNVVDFNLRARNEPRN